MCDVRPCVEPIRSSHYERQDAPLKPLAFADERRRPERPGSCARTGAAGPGKYLTNGIHPKGLPMKRSDPSSRPRRTASRWPAVVAALLVATIGTQPAVAAQRSAPSESTATESTATVAAAAGDIDGF